MRVTVDVPDDLWALLQRLASERGVALDTLVVEVLRQVLAPPTVPPFRLVTRPFAGQGLHPDLAGATWDEIRALVYEGRGG